MSLTHYEGMQTCAYVVPIAPNYLCSVRATVESTSERKSYRGHNIAGYNKEQGLWVDHKHGRRRGEGEKSKVMWELVLLAPGEGIEWLSTIDRRHYQSWDRLFGFAKPNTPPLPISGGSAMHGRVIEVHGHCRCRYSA